MKPVPQEAVDAVLPHVSPQVKAMIELQLLTGMRPGEVTIMRNGDIDLTLNPWLYRPSRHKTQHHSHERLVYLGPQAQEIIRPFLKMEAPDTFLFSPADAMRILRLKRHALRKTPLSCENIPGSNRKRRPKRKPRDHYRVCAYGQAIAKGCRKAFPPPEGLDHEDIKKWHKDHRWHPHQLRHNAATRLRKEYGLDVAQVILGHKTLSVTQIYAERDVEAAQKVTMRVG